MLNTVISAVSAATTAPVTPAPLRKGMRAVVYRYYTGQSDGRVVKGRLEFRFMGKTFAEAYELMTEVRQALITDDGESRIGTGASRIVITETDAGGVSGYAHRCGLYYVKTTVKLEGRGDIYG